MVWNGVSDLIDFGRSRKTTDNNDLTGENAQVVNWISEFESYIKSLCLFCPSSTTTWLTFNHFMFLISSFFRLFNSVTLCDESTPLR